MGGTPLHLSLFLPTTCKQYVMRDEKWKPNVTASYVRVVPVRLLGAVSLRRATTPVVEYDFRRAMKTITINYH